MDITKKLISYDTVCEIYAKPIFTLKQIYEHLNIWDSLTLEQKGSLTDSTKDEINLSISLSHLSDEDKLKFVEQNWDVKEKYSLGYGEISKSGVEKLNSYIEKNITDNDVFYDIGSGNGKLSLHMSLISNFNSIKGIEINNIRFLYSQSIKESIGNFDKVIFYNESVLDMDLSDASVVFMNDVLFSELLVNSIIDKLKKGTHLISFNNQLYFNCFENLTYIDSFNVNVSWMDLPVTFNHYII